MSFLARVVCWLISSGIVFGQEAFRVSVEVDAGKAVGELRPFWRMFGADEPNYTTMKNGRKLTRELGELRPGEVYFRAHNLLTSGDGSPALKWGSTGVYSEDAEGRAVYSWRILDEIFDTYLANKVRPYAQIGFMPQALSVKPEPYQHRWTPQARYEQIYTGWAYPPKDYDKWRELVFQWVKHCVERYGKAEVENWYWETWNEANIGYWRGTPEEFLKLHDYAIDGVKRALPTARVGGPDSAGSGGRFTRNFLEHCLRGTNFATGKVGTPIDFVSFHAKGAPVFTNGHVRMGIATHLRTVEEGFKLVASFPELKGAPIVIGESDPEGCAACQGPQLGYRNGTMYSSYTAASFARKWELARAVGVNLDAALTWAFTFEDQPLFAGFRQIATGGIDMPVLNVFRIFSRMGGQQIDAVSDGAISLEEIKANGVREKPDVGVLAARDAKRVTVMLWHYHDDDLAGPAAKVALKVGGLGNAREGVKVTRHLIDAEHSNSYAVWQKMGSPQEPTAEEYVELEKAGALPQVGTASAVTVKDGQAEIEITLARQAVALVTIAWE